MRLLSSTNKDTRWEIETHDKGAIVLLKGGEDRKLTLDDIGMVYVVKMGGDTIEWPEKDEQEEVLS